jgi:putative salt-induced outer membrane protein
MLARVLAASAALLVGSVAFAADGGDETEGFSGEGEFGLVATTGNTETETLNAKLAGAYTQQAWVYKLGLTAVSASEDDVRTAERYQLSGKTEYHTTEFSHWFGALRYEEDKFGGFDHQGIFTVGYGRTLVERETSYLDLEAGIGARRTQPAEDPETGIEPDGATNAVLRGAAEYWWQFTENARLQNDFLVESGEDNTFLQNQIGLRVAVNDRFAVKLGLEVRHNTQAPEDLDKTDTVSTVNLVYSFK